MNADNKALGFDKRLDSQAYKTDLAKTVSEIIRKCDRFDTESTIASVFENELYHFIRVQFNTDIKFKKESGKNYFRHTFQGRVDAFHNDVVIEYKRPTKLATSSDQDNALSQTMDYLTQLSDEGKYCNGLVTDGNRICFLYWRNRVLKKTGFSTINAQSLDRVVRLLIGSKEKHFSAENILNDFSLSNHSNPTYALSQALFECLVDRPTQRTEMLYEEWLSLFHLAEADSGKNKDIIDRRKVLSEYFSCDMTHNDLDYKGLFALQTTYAIVIKLMACKVIGKLAYKDDIQYFSDLVSVGAHDLLDFLTKLEDGYVFSTGGIRNLLEGDFFSWYCSTTQWGVKLYEPLLQIIAQVELYSNVATSRTSALDIFKDLYMDYIPQEVRHSLGEYYTPDWLAERIVENSISGCERRNTWRGIDPCCGSGVFLMKMINRIIGDVDVSSLDQETKSKLLDTILQRVIGIDINPLSVLTARVNYFLAISSLRGPHDEIEIPVYVGDTAVMPRTITLCNVDCYEYTISTTKKSIRAVLPVEFVKSKSFLKTMNSIQTYVNAGSKSLLLEQLKQSIAPNTLNQQIIEALDRFSEDLVMLHENQWDGIWVRIVSNFMLVARISDCDLIVGNPPWVKWEFLPETYAERLKQACLEKQMFSGQSFMGAISLNICAAIAIITASAWLREGGVLGFLMPKNLLTQDSYEGFRYFRLSEPQQGKRLFLYYVEEWSKAGKLFGKDSVEPCAAYYYRHKPIDYQAGFPIVQYRKLRGEDWTGCTEWHEVEHCFEEIDLIGAQIDSRRSGYTIVHRNSRDLIAKFQVMVGNSEYKGRTGVEFVPNEVTFLESRGPTSSDETWMFRSLELRASRHRPVTHEDTTLERVFIRPLLTAPEIKDFAIESRDLFCLFPYYGTETYCCDMPRMAKMAPQTMQYLIKNKHLFKQQSERSQGLTRGNEFYALSKVGPYTYHKNMVVIRDNTRMCASVVEPREMPWGELKMPIPAKHAAIITTHTGRTGSPITEDEAYYVAGIFNTPAVREWFAATYSGRSYSIKLPIKVPLYCQGDPHFEAIMALSREAHLRASKQQDVDALEREIEMHYIMICTD